MTEKGEMILEKRMEKRRRRRKAKTKFILVFLFFLCVLTFALYSPIFNIKEIEVYGVYKLKQAEVANASHIPLGINIFKFNAFKAKKEIETQPYVKTAVVQRFLPDKVRITVKERTPVAAVEYLNSYILIDKEGISLEVEPDIKSKKIIEIKGVKVNKFSLGKPILENNKANLEPALGLLTLLQKDDLLLQIDYVDMTDLNKIVINVDKRFEVNFGDKSILDSVGDFKYRINVLKSMIKSDELKGQSGTIDLTKEKPIFRPKVEGEIQP